MGWHWTVDHHHKAYIAYKVLNLSPMHFTLYLWITIGRTEKAATEIILCSVVQGREAASERLHDQPRILSWSPDSHAQLCTQRVHLDDYWDLKTNRSKTALSHVCKTTLSLSLFFCSFNNLKGSSESQIFFFQLLRPKILQFKLTMFFLSNSILSHILSNTENLTTCLNWSLCFDL